MESYSNTRQDLFPIVVEVLAGIVVALLVAQWVGLY
jgi:hypothetical protein